MRIDEWVLAISISGPHAFRAEVEMEFEADDKELINGLSAEIFKAIERVIKDKKCKPQIRQTMVLDMDTREPKYERFKKVEK